MRFNIFGETLKTAVENCLAGAVGAMLQQQCGRDNPEVIHGCYYEI